MSRRKPYQFKPGPEGAPKVWRNLEDKDASPDILAKRAEAEMPEGFVDQRSLLGRRSFLATSTASAAALSLSGCIRRPEENILPFSRAPEYVVPGVPLHFATVSERRGDAIGHLVTSHVGRPTKVEGNPEHPSSHGATDIAGQASIMDLYDPDRSVGPARSEEGGLVDSTFAEFDEAFGALMQTHSADGGAGLKVLMRGTTSPSVARLRAQIANQLPNAGVHVYSPVNEDNFHEGARVAFGQPVNTLYNLEASKVILAIDSDFLSSEPGALRHSRSFANGRRIRNGQADMSRLYAVESTFSNTGASADHRLRLPSRDVGRYLLALAKTLSADHAVSLGALDRWASEVPTDGLPAEWLGTVAGELAANRGHGAILVGGRQPAWVHALGHYLNYALRNNAPSGGTIAHVAAPWHGSSNSLEELGELAEAIRGGSVQTLLILGGNPVYDAPGDVGFAGLMNQDGLTTVHVASHRNETSLAASWHVPEAHELETWGDARAFDGTVSIQQPLIRPMRGGRSAIEFLAQIGGERHWRGHSQVRKTFRLEEGTPGWEGAWRRSLHRGIVAGTEAPPSRGTSVRGEAVAVAVGEGQSTRAGLGRDNFEVVFVPDDRIHDGRHANNPWLLETPEPMTKMVWDNAALLSVQTAQQMGITSGDMLRVSRGDANIDIPAWVLPGHADWSVTLPLGWGRTAAGEYGNGCGFDVNPLRSTDGFDFSDGARVERTGGTYQLVQTQTHHSMEGRPLAIDGTLEAVDAGEGDAYHGLPAYSEESDFTQYRAVEFTNGPLWEQADYTEGHKWGMAIDLTTCTGCNACVVACQAENNIPTVGKREVQRGREMHWIRIDRYFVGDDMDDPIVALQPVACQQCEEAPCENVCPVNATTHSPEGLNDMAYNRCVGTRYCANNCPYKVRRFNYLNWHGTEDPHGYTPETVQMAFNPNVTVRMRGVMEKCTYCVQRIQEARISSRREGRDLRDGDITPACSQTCASQSIVFGDLNDQSSRVSQLVAQDQHYRLLEEVGAQPRTTYLGQIRNPNPAMFSSAATATEEAES